MNRESDSYIKRPPDKLEDAILRGILESKSDMQVWLVGGVWSWGRDKCKVSISKVCCVCYAIGWTLVRSTFSVPASAGTNSIYFF